MITRYLKALYLHGKSSSSPWSRVTNQVPPSSSTASTEGAPSSCWDVLRYNEICSWCQLSGQCTGGQLAPLGQGQSFALKAWKPLMSLLPGLFRCTPAVFTIACKPAKGCVPLCHLFLLQGTRFNFFQTANEEAHSHCPFPVCMHQMSRLLDATLKGQEMLSCLRQKIKMCYL